MSNDKDVSYGIGADPSPFVAGMDKAAQAAKGGTDKIKAEFDKVGKAFEEVQKRLIMITAIVAGGAFFKDAIAASAKLAGEQMSLAKRLGITGTEASALNTALGDIGSDSETYIGAFDKFAKQIKTNESGLNEMGLKTRDANGHLRDSKTLFQEALQTVGQYKPGLDQTTAAMQLFGKGVDDAMKLQRLNNQVIEEARKKNEELGLTLTQEGVAASKAYKAAMNDVGDVMQAVQNTIGQAVMPIFTELGNYFASTGPGVIAVFKGALTGLVLVFRSIQLVVKSVANAIFEFINFTIDQVQNLGELISRVLSGDFKGAGAVWENMKERTREGVRNVLAATKEEWDKASMAFGDDYVRIWSKGTAVDKLKGGTKTQGPLDANPGAAKKEKKDPSFMKYYEAALEEERRLANERDALHGLGKQGELNFWNTILRYAQLSESDRIDAQKKSSSARIEVLKEEAQRANQLGALNLAAWEQRELGQAQAAQDAAQTRLALGLMSQEQMLQQELAFEARRAEIRRTAIEANRAALDPARDPVQLAQLNNQLEQIEAEHLRRLDQIRGQIAVQGAAEQRKIWTDLGSRMTGLWDQGMQAMLNGTLTWRSALKAVFSEIAAWFAKTVVGDMIKKWAAGKAAQLAASIAGTTAEKSLQVAGSAAVVATKATEATAVVTANAAEAASGAAASQAPIPVVGPGLAAAAFAGVMAMVMGALGSIKSARGGFDIPAGVNPLTQLHESEMVLPKAQADVIRDLAGGGGGAGSASIVIHTTGGDFIHKNDLGRLLQQMNRRFVFK